jgi:hypothetical protein
VKSDGGWSAEFAAETKTIEKSSLQDVQKYSLE